MRREYVNGCIGGRSPKGEVTVDFFAEHPPALQSETYRVENGQMRERTKCVPSDHVMERDVVFGVVMTETTAREIYQWLGRLLSVSDQRVSRVQDAEFRIQD